MLLIADSQHVWEWLSTMISDVLTGSQSLGTECSSQNFLIATNPTLDEYGNYLEVQSGVCRKAFGILLVKGCSFFLLKMGDESSWPHRSVLCD